MTDTLASCIGNTPLVEIKRLNPNPRVTILAKLEYMNPGGSVKDRAASYMIADGEASGELTPDKIVLEATSGNTGIGLALICAVRGYRLLLAMSENASEERKKILRARGAEILLTPGHLGTDGAIEEVYRLAREYPDTYFMTDQFNNEANWKAHYDGTAEEIWRQTEGRVTAVVATLGTSGTAMGLSRRLKELNDQVRLVGVEPYLGHKIQGLKNMKESYRPDIFQRRWLDAKPNIDDEDAFEMARRLAKEEGLFVGMSSGAAMAVACREAAEMTGGTLVVIFPDSGERYLSTSLYTVQDTIDLRLFNTVSRKKELFEPLQSGRVSIYSCGPTAHARLDLSQIRRMVCADLLSRYLKYRGYAVQHVVNITDFDDKTIAGAARAGLSLEAFTGQYIDLFKADMERVKVEAASDYPVTSEEIPAMVELAEKLVKNGAAYEKLRSVYFDISSLPEYGSFSHVDPDKIRLGATVDLDEYEKDNPRDFTLLKRAKMSELKQGLYVKTRWGNVRPSLHIQCAAISRKYLGEQFDIHTGSSHLVFPHHENEIAIARAENGQSPARYWVHCENILAEDADAAWKTARLTIEEIEQMGISGRQLRYWLIAGHYRKPLSFSLQRVTAMKGALDRLDNCVKSLSALAGASSAAPSCGQGDSAAADGPKAAFQQELDQLLYDIRQGFIAAMDDDLNVSEALASVFQNIKTVNRFLSRRALTAEQARAILEAFGSIDSVLQVFDFKPAAAVDSPRVQELMAQREQARQAGDWTKADQLREQLQELGVTVVDGKV